MRFPRRDWAFRGDEAMMHIDYSYDVTDDAERKVAEFDEFRSTWIGIFNGIWMGALLWALIIAGVWWLL